MKVKLTVFLVSILAISQLVSADSEKKKTANVIFLSHLDKAQGSKGKLVSVKYPSGMQGKIKGQVNFIKSHYGNGVLCSSAKDSVIFNAKDVITSNKGSIELWLKVNKDISEAKENLSLIKIEFD
ncbi:MAG: hypothetical protein U9O87_06040, partial [Verrucomicrobiota bacterium]|nr:hypothetical protein [Verrucomicrobiota bacterium]